MRLNIDALQELYNTLTYGPVLSSPYAESPIDRAFKECDEKLSGSAAFAHIKDLENRCENLERSNKTLRDDNDKLGDKVIGLNKKNEQLEKDLDICKRSNEMLLASSMESISEKRKLENEIEDLKKDKERFKEGCAAKSKENAALVSANADLSDRNARLQRNFDRINHLWTSQIQENMELRSKIANLQREKKNYETIAKEREELLKEKELVEKQLNHYKNIYCCGYSFKKADESDTKKYYEKARGCGQYTLKDATFYFDNQPVTMGGTIEATVEVNKDLLEKVCGVKHKLDYGDAVRVPWRDYDYMYIGPEGKHIRLFDPKTHAVVLVSVTDNLTYQGCKIILFDEDDIRKIWKDKK